MQRRYVQLLRAPTGHLLTSRRRCRLACQRSFVKREADTIGRPPTSRSESRLSLIRSARAAARRNPCLTRVSWRLTRLVVVVRWALQRSSPVFMATCWPYVSAVWKIKIQLAEWCSRLKSLKQANGQGETVASATMS